MGASVGFGDLEGDEIIEVHPRVSVEEARAALVTLLREGLVELYDIEAEGMPILESEEALRVALEPAYWIAEQSPRRIALVMTDRGDELVGATTRMLYEQARRRRR